MEMKPAREPQRLPMTGSDDEDCHSCMKQDLPIQSLPQHVFKFVFNATREVVSHNANLHL